MNYFCNFISLGTSRFLKVIQDFDVNFIQNNTHLRLVFMLISQSY